MAAQNYSMNKTMLAVVIFAGLTAPVLADDTNVLSDEKSKVSYAIGMTIGHNFQQQGIDVDTGLFMRGLTDAKSGGATLLTMPEMQATLKQFQQDMAAKQAKLRAAQAETNKLAGEAFLATNKNNPGIIALPDGLQYQILTAGTGAKPAPDATVTVNYRGTFLDGTEFDSSAKAGHPLSVHGESGGSRLDGSAHEHAGRLKVAVVHPFGACLWRAGKPRHSAEFDSDF